MSVKSVVQDTAAVFYQRAYDFERRRTHRDASRRPVVLFTSVSRSDFGGNMAFVRDGMRRRGLDELYEVRSWFRSDIPHAEDPASQLDFVRELAAADIIFVDDYHPFLYLVNFPDDVKVVQLWHAIGAFKRIGFSRYGHDSEHRRRTSRAHRSYTHVIVSANCDRIPYADAFNLPATRIYPTGVPRVDGFLDPGVLQAAKRGFYEQFPQAVGRRVILFAPTFRGDDVRAAGYDFDMLDITGIAQVCRNTNSILVLKFHPFTKRFPGIPSSDQDVVVDASAIREVNDILPAADLLVTDYSSVIYEASLLALPMLFYAYDLADYEQNRGFYEPYETFVPGDIVRTPDQFATALIATDSDALRKRSLLFRDRHFAHVDRHNTDRVIDLVF